MKLKKIVFAFALTLSVAPVLAQDFTDKSLDERIGFSNNNNEDSIKTGRGYVSYFQQSLQNQDWQGAHLNYQWLIKNAPFAITGIYTQGPFMFYQLIVAEQDQAKKLAYFNEMMSLFEARIWMFSTPLPKPNPHWAMCWRSRLTITTGQLPPYRALAIRSISLMRTIATPSR